ncbi:glycoside hydrolase family 3 N-terminal domain-containing protein [Nakamurella sp. PAMC28650]|uniref:glycoside hydrolase family 3 N-terminal domain-containing protein n=1 Tax=Nakamurella sp. PAMC28650 TaxID=2762325 RepID=UPI00164D904B|nr:glycoside hydrolase family 3 N-terminal domain-containing protein [Nakamurella sp. PAMC28650]QNK83320.1 glycoside hydrolase family 3 C-terminal domain-containing protein [Nakamurella sp. PAMC28650]
MTDHQLSRRSALAGLGGTAVIGALSTSLLTGPEASAATPVQTTVPVPATDPAGSPPLNKKVEQRVGALLKRMTLAEKLGQLQLVNTPDLARKALATTPCGGVFSVIGAAQLNALQKQAVQHTRLGIPLIFGLDVIHGYTTNFPIPLGQASSFDPAVAETDAIVSAAEARRSGINWTYSPMMDVTHEPRWGRIAEGDGEDPYLASQMAVAKVRGYQGSDYSAPDKVAACAKHYVAYGGTEGGRDYNTVDVSIQELHNHYLPPFKASVAAGVATLMASFNTVAGVPAHANSYTLRNVLKDAFDFNGFVVSDYTGIQELIMHGVAGDGADAAAAGITAGVDMEMVSTNYVDFGKELLARGRISQSEIDDAVRRILRVKYSLGLFEHPYVDEAGEVTAVSAAARAKARSTGSRSMVLLKNDQAVLPLQKTAKVAVIGPLAVATYDLNGTWSGLGTGAGTTPPVTVLDGIRAAAGSPASVTYARGCDIESADTSGFAAATAAAAAADVVVLALGESAAMSGEASARSNIDLPGVQQQLLASVVVAGKPVVVVLFNGRPLTLQSTHDTATAILEAWAPGVEAGNAVADVLFGKVNPGGKLPVSFPRAVGQIPIYYNHQNTGRPADPNNKYTSKYLDLATGPLYGFGFGLSYTSFTISAPKLSSPRMNRHGGHLTVSVDVVNTGAVAGDEVVQLYVHDPVASIAQPVRRLRGFRRVGLQAGQSKRVTFTLTTDDVGFYDNRARFLVETGLVEVYVGNSSAADQKVTFTVV